MSNKRSHSTYKCTTPYWGGWQFDNEIKDRTLIISAFISIYFISYRMHLYLVYYIVPKEPNSMLSRLNLQTTQTLCDVHLLFPLCLLLNSFLAQKTHIHLDIINDEFFLNIFMRLAGLIIC